MRSWLLFLMLCCLPAFPANAAEPVTLLYASHLADIQHPKSGGFPALATLLATLRETRENVVFIHGGNVLGPSSLSAFDKGAHMISLLNMLEPSAMAVGRRDFMHREDELILRASEALFPMICSNVLDPLSGGQPEGLKRMEILSEDACTLGMVALVSPELGTSYIQERVMVTGEYDLLPNLIQALRDKGAQCALAAADFMPVDPAKTLESTGADILFIAAGEENRLLLEKGKALVLHGSPEQVVLIELLPDENGALYPAKAEFLSLADYAPDQAVADTIQHFIGSLETLMSLPVGTTRTALDTTRVLLRTQENAFANMVADAMREYYNADVALLNAGGLRGDRSYAAGTVLTRGDLQTEMPLHDNTCFTTMTGAELMAALEHGLSGVEKIQGRFLHVSGMHYKYTPSTPPGQRLLSATINKDPLDPEKSYRVSVPSYLINRGDGFTMFNGICDSPPDNPSQSLTEVVRTHITKHTPVAPVAEGRITVKQ